MKKKVLALFVALGIMCGGVPAYAANTDTVPITEYAEALQNLYTANYVYMLTKYTDDMLYYFSSSEVANSSSAYFNRNNIPTEIALMNYTINNLEEINKLITDNHVSAFYGVQTDITKLVNASKTYVEACRRIYNYDNSGYYLATSVCGDIFQSVDNISKSCAQIMLVPEDYLVNAMQELRDKYE